MPGAVRCPRPGNSSAWRNRHYFDEQVDEIMRTDSTRTFCAVEDVDAVLDPEGDVALAELPLVGSRRPRISTSWFACWRSSLLSPSRM
jgi:hypothetical protein